MSDEPIQTYTVPAETLATQDVWFPPSWMFFAKDGGSLRAIPTGGPGYACRLEIQSAPGERVSAIELGPTERQMLIDWLTQQR